jgi:LacI family transcriptional regulator
LPSQRDVAALAGVSRATVSAVLNGSTAVKIAEATQHRVRAAANELGFRPNEIARGLRSRRSNVLGLLSSELATTPYAVAIIRGAQRAALRHGMMLLIIDTDGAVEMTADAVAAMARWRVEGLIMAADHHRAIEACSVDAVHGPVILANCFAAKDDLGSVVPDERQGGALAVETLVAAGHRRIGFINGPADFPASEGRLRGYLDVHRAAGIEVDQLLITTGDWWQESGMRNAAALLDLDDPPTALFCANDWMAMGAYDAIKERGLRIPADVAVIGFDNRVEIAAHMRPALTTVALPYHEIGERAVERLLANDDGSRMTQDLVTCPLVRRDSV